VVAFVVAAGLASAVTAAAQGRTAVEIVPRAMFAADRVADANLGTGIGVGVSASVAVRPRWSPYVGWDWRRARAEPSFAGPDVEVEETGYAFGLQYAHPVRASSLLVVRGGLTYHHVEIENPAGAVVADSGHGFGWEAGAGLSIPMGRRWSIVPGVRFRTLTRDLDLESVSTPVTLRSVALEVGLSRRF
jgi:hypothetical protein